MLSKRLLTKRDRIRNWRFLLFLAIHIGDTERLSIPPRKPAPNRNAPAPQKEEEHRINNRIESRDVRLINAEGENVGVVPTRQALIMAEEAGLDLVEISPGANPPRK